jgi:hypothetical protein
MPTLRQLLDELVQRPGLHVKRCTTGVQTDATGAYAGVASGDDAKRVLVSSDLARVTVSGMGSDVDPSWYQGAYAWVVESGTSPNLERTVAQSGYAPSETASDVTDQAASAETVGVLTLTRTMGAVIAAGRSVELHAPLPPLTDDDKKVSLRSWINRALFAMRRRVTLEVVAEGGESRLDLSAYPWIAEEADLIGVRDRELLTNVDAPELPGETHLRFDGANVYLNLGVYPVDGATYFVDLYRRLRSWIAVTAKGTATIAANAVTAVTVTRGGTYSPAPTVTFSGGGGTGAAGTAVLTNGTVTSVTITAGGSGYTTAPTATFSAGTYATSSVGLVNLDDVCLGETSVIADVAYALLADDLSVRHGQGADPLWVSRRALVEETVRPYLQFVQGRSRRPRPVSVSAIRDYARSSTRRRWN